MFDRILSLVQGCWSPILDDSVGIDSMIVLVSWHPHVKSSLFKQSVWWWYGAWYGTIWS